MVTIRIARMIREILCDPAASFFERLFRGKGPAAVDTPNPKDAADRNQASGEEEVALMDR